MSINPLNNHYSMENPASVYDEEAMTALELAARTTAKVNETVAAFNKLEDDTLEHLENQDLFIEKMNNETMPEKVKEEVQDHIDNGDFDAAIDQYAGMLETRVNNLLGSVTEGSTTLDAELLDMRVMEDGTVAETAGNAVRAAWRYTPRFPELFFTGDPVLNFDTVNGKVSSQGSFFAGEGLSRYTIPTFDLPIVGGVNVHILVYNTKTKVVECIKEADYNRSTQIIICYFAYNSIKNGLSCSFPVPYYIDGVRIAADKEIKEARTDGNGTTYPTLKDRLHYQDGRINQTGELFFPESSSGLNFDTVAGVLTVKGNSYVVCGKTRYNFEGTREVPFPETTSNTLCLVVDTENALDCHYKIIPYNSFNRYNHILIFVFNKNVMNVPVSNTIMMPYTSDGATYSRYDTVVTPDAAKVAYVAPTGDNNNSGTSASPFATIQKAIDSGASTIMVAPGTYKGKVVSNVMREKLHILCGWGEDFSATDNPKRGKIVLDCSEDIRLAWDETNQVYKAPYTASTSSIMYRVFITQDTPLQDSGDRSDGYNMTLWVISAKPNLKVKPVLTVDELGDGTEWRWTYDGEWVYLKSPNMGSPVAKLSGNLHGMEISNCRDLVIEDFVVQYPRTNGLSLTNCNNVMLRNCEFTHSALSNGLYMYDSNGRIENCIATYNRNDGFNFHGFGDTTVINCKGINNFDDGISHHDGCSGAIIGGYWKGNNKGGVASPTFGAMVNITGAVIMENGYGIYATDNTGLVKSDSIICVTGCLIYGNTVGIHSSYPMIGTANKLQLNTTETEFTGNGGFTNL